MCFNVVGYRHRATESVAAFSLNIYFNQRYFYLLTNGEGSRAEGGSVAIFPLVISVLGDCIESVVEVCLQFACNI